jgi:translation initiation factor IF-2
MELKADPDEKAIGVVIESRFLKGLGPSAVILIDNGTLKMSDFVAVGSAYGRIRLMEDFSGKKITAAGPSMPVRIAGLRSLPSFGNRLIAFETEKEAKEASLRTDERIKSTMRIATAKRIENQSGENKIKVSEFNIIAKSDVVGSLEALKKLLSEIHHPEIKIKIISEGVGPISESDVTLANATSSILYGFRVPVLMAAKKIAEKEGISIRNYDVIYKLIDDVKAEASKLLPPEVIEKELGRLRVLAIFRDDRKGFVIGGKLESGTLQIGNEVRVLQDGNDKYHDKITSLRQGKNEVKECSAGVECGIGLNPGAKVSVGDVIIAYKTTQKERTIE